MRASNSADGTLRRIRRRSFTSLSPSQRNQRKVRRFGTLLPQNHVEFRDIPNARTGETPYTQHDQFGAVIALRHHKSVSHPASRVERFTQHDNLHSACRIFTHFAQNRPVAPRLLKVTSTATLQRRTSP